MYIREIAADDDESFRIFIFLWLLTAIILIEVNAGAQLALVGCIVQGAVPAKDPVLVSTADAAWIASAPAVALMLSIPMASYTMDRFGRRTSLAATTLPALVSSLVVSRAHSVTVIVIGKLIMGIALDALFLGAIVTGECSSPKYRGVFLNFKSAMMILGSSLIHFLNYYLDWRTLSLICVPLVLTSLGILCSCPESPYWYILKNRFKEAEYSFVWLRGTSEEALREFRSLVSAQKLRTRKVNKRIIRGRFSLTWQAIKKKDFLLPVITIYLSSVFLEAAGRHTFVTFALKFIADIVGENNKSSVYLVAIDLVIILSILLSCVLVKHIPRRALMFSTGFSASFILGLTSLYLYFQSAQMLSVYFKSVWIPITLIASFFLLVNVGCIPICISLLGELLPLAHKGLGVVIAGVASKLNIISSMTLIPFLLSSIKVQGTFATSALVMSLALIGLYLTLPETKDRTLQEIEDAYRSRDVECKVDEDELKDIISNS